MDQDPITGKVAGGERAAWRVIGPDWVLPHSDCDLNHTRIVAARRGQVKDLWQRVHGKVMRREVSVGADQLSVGIDAIAGHDPGQEQRLLLAVVGELELEAIP